MKITKSYKFRLKPNKIQRQNIEKTFDGVRFYWNKSVEWFNDYKENKNQKFPTTTEFRREHEFLKEISASPLQQKERDFRQFKQQFFSKTRKNKLGFPKFKSRKNDQSYRLPNQKFEIKSDKIRFERIGWMKFDNHRQFPENSKFLSATISRNRIGQYFVSINFEFEKEPRSKQDLQNVGIDLGLKELATLSSGVVFGNPKVFSESQAKLKYIQQHFSRKKKGSNRWNKNRKKIAKLHLKIKNQREWYLHNVSRWIVDNYNEISMEDLRVQEMMKNRRLSKSISDASMSTLKEFISYKQLEYGLEVQLLGTFEPSTKVCSSCGTIKPMTLADRTFECDKCGLIMDRDLNAANVIRDKVVGVNTTQRTLREIKTKPHSNVKFRILDEAFTFLS